jgi:hypothetical protein
LTSVDTEIREINQLLATQLEVAVEPLSDDAFQDLLGRKLANFVAALTAGAEVAKRTIRRHIAKLVMTPIETSEVPKYLIKSDILVFANDDPDGVLLDGSLKRTIKQYTSLTIPFVTTLSTKDGWADRSSGKELYWQVRQAITVGGRTQRSVALEFGLQTSVVRKLLRHTVPPM